MKTTSALGVHTPWRRKLLIVLFTFQLLFTIAASFFLTWDFVIAILNSRFRDIRNGTNRYAGNYPLRYNYAFYPISSAITAIINLTILASIIVNIVKFAKFTLATRYFQSVCIAQVVGGFTSMVMRAAALDILGTPLLAIQVTLSIWLLVYAVKARKAVMSGVGREMRRPGVDGDEGPFVELDERGSQISRTQLVVGAEGK